MKLLIPAALIVLAVYCGTLLSPRIKSLVIKLKNKLTNQTNKINNQEKEKENESKSN